MDTAAAATKRVRVCLHSDPRPAADCPTVALDLAAINSWGEPLLAALAAGAQIDPVSITSVWLREDDEDTPNRLDKEKRSTEQRWNTLLKADSDESVLLLGIDATVTASAANPVVPGFTLRGLGDDDEVAYSSEDQQNYERLARLLLKDPYSYTMLQAIQRVRPPLPFSPHPSHARM